MAAPNPASPTQTESRTTENFRVHARLIAEIGDELISADEIALYELIKNAFDAGSPWVRVEVTTPVAASEIGPTVETIASSWDASLLEQSPLTPLLEVASTRDRIQAAIEAQDEAALTDTLVDALKDASQIVIEDRGEGMDRSRLEEGFLSLATPLRLRQAGVGPNGRPVLGSKGLGRFSAQRLGRHLRVESAPPRSPTVNVLEIDWTKYAADDGAYLDEVDNELWSEPNSSNVSGTRLIITRLNEVWTREKLQELAKSRIAQLMNPFFPTDFSIHLRMNGDPVEIASFQRAVLSKARLRVKGRVDPERNPPLSLSIWYLGKKVPTTVPTAEQELPPLNQLRSVGPFDFELWEFDRNDRTLGMVGRTTVIGGFVDTWGGGGPMLFRDGFRVFPYGQRGNDWLELESRFFRARAGSRLRTPAVVGYVAIHSKQNPKLEDLSNREGLRMTPTGTAFVKTLEGVIDIINQEYRILTPPKKDDGPAQMSAFRRTMEDAIGAAVDQAAEARDSVSGDPEAQAAVSRLAESVDSINVATRAFLALGDKLGGSISPSSYQSMLELAGLGMTSEHIAHELSSLIDRGLGLLDQIGSSDVSTSIRLRLGQLRSNLDSIRGVVAYLTPLTQASRRRRVVVDVAAELRTAANHYPALTADVGFEVDVRAPLNVRMSRGVLLQVLDNLITNSIYWLHEKRPAKPTIRTVVDGGDQTVLFSDNGPGISSKIADLIFEPFMSTRRQGRGLGLFIARELLELETAALSLGPADQDGRLRTFVIDLKGPSQRESGG
jgi:hypothetical protein